MTNVDYYLEQCNFIYNKAISGGGIYVNNLRPSQMFTNEILKSSNFTNNIVKYYGGGLYIISS